MATSFNVDMFLSSLAMSYAMPAETTTVTSSTEPRPATRKPRKVTQQTEQTDVLTSIPASTPTVEVVKPGTLDAAGFFAAIKVAGKRPNTAGVMSYAGTHEQREDEHAAVQAFIGWDNSLPHGTNLDNARIEANRQVKSVKPTKEYSRSSKPTMAGFVAGIPDNQRKRVDNLMGRLNKALDDLIVHEAARDDDSLPQGTRDHHAMMAQLESERVQSISADLKKMGF